MTGGRSGLRPGRRAKMLPIRSTVTVQPASSHQPMKSRRASPSRSLAASRHTPPFAVAPIRANSIRLAHSRSPFTVRLRISYSLVRQHRHARPLCSGGNAASFSPAATRVGRRVPDMRRHGRQAFDARQCENLSPRSPRGLCIGGDWQSPQILQSSGNPFRDVSSPALGTEQNVREFKMPKVGNDRSTLANQVKHRFRARRCFIVKAPTQRDRGIDDDSAHGRPSSRSSFQDRPPRVVSFRKRRSCATASSMSAWSISAALTSRAIGLHVL